MSDRPLPPQPTTTETCVVHRAVGKRTVAATGWRWLRASGSWEPVCASCAGGPEEFRRGDYIPDWANVPRQEAK